MERKDRNERLAEALRANLRRRRQQQRARADGGREGAVNAGPDAAAGGERAPGTGEPGNGSKRKGD